MYRKPWQLRSKLLLGTCAVILVGALAVVKPVAALAAPTEMFYLCAPGAWTFYNEAKKYLMNGGIDLDSSTFRMGHRPVSSGLMPLPTFGLRLAATLRILSSPCCLLRGRQPVLGSCWPSLNYQRDSLR